MGEDIDVLIKRYGDMDIQLKELKNQHDKDKESLKTELEWRDEKDWTANGYTVQRIVSERETLDEEKLLPILKDNWVKLHGSMECPYIKTKEYIDMDALESAIYEAKLSPDVLKEMDTCRQTTTVVTLKCKKAKTEDN